MAKFEELLDFAMEHGTSVSSGWSQAQIEFEKQIHRLGGKVVRNETRDDMPIIEVSLSKAQITDKYIGELVNGFKLLDAFQHLRELDLTDTRLTDAAMQQLVRLKMLQTLKIGNTMLSDAGLMNFSAFQNLKLLDIRFTNVTDAGLTHLKGLCRLQRLFLVGTKVRGDGLKELAGLRQLKTLDLSETKLTDAGLNELTVLKQLRTLSLAGTTVTDAGVAELKKAMPECHVIHRAKTA